MVESYRSCLWADYEIHETSILQVMTKWTGNFKKKYIFCRTFNGVIYQCFMWFYPKNINVLIWRQNQLHLIFDSLYHLTR